MCSAVSFPTERPVPGADTEALRNALADRGVHAFVDADGTLAILRPFASMPPLDATARADLVRLAKAHGFTHVALELAPSDEPAPIEDAELHRDQPRV